MLVVHLVDNQDIHTQILSPSARIIQPLDMDHDVVNSCLDDLDRNTS